MATGSIICWVHVCVARETRDENRRRLPAHANFTAVPIGVSG